MTRVDELGALAFMLALALSLGRPYLGMHYPSDVVLGTALGIVLGLSSPCLAHCLNTPVDRGSEWRDRR